MDIVPCVQCLTTDVCVPISKLPQVVTETREDLNSSGLIKGAVNSLLKFRVSVCPPTVCVCVCVCVYLQRPYLVMWGTATSMLSSHTIKTSSKQLMK